MTSTRDNPMTARRRDGAAFTLIELMIVIAIIVVMVAVLLVGGAQWRKSAKVTQTRMMFDALDRILDEYHSEVGRYPNPADYGTDFQLFVAAVEDVGDIPKMVGTLKETEGLDPWGNPIVVIPSINQTRRPTFRSDGPDRLPNTSDDIVSGAQP